MRKGLTAFMAGLACLIGATLAQGAAAPPPAPASGVLKLRIAHIFEEKYAWHVAFERFRDLLKTRSNGTLEVQIFPNRMLGEEKDYISFLRQGALDMATVSTGGLSTVVKEAGFFDLMYLWRDHEQWERALDGEVGKMMSDAIRAGTSKGGAPGFEVLGYWSGSELNIVSRSRGYQTVRDLEGVKIRSQGLDVQMEQWRLLGANPVVVPYEGIYDAFRTGSLDATPGITGAMYTTKSYEVAPYVSLTAHCYIVRPFVMSGQTWNKLSAAQKKIVVEAAHEATALARTLEAQQNDEYAEILKTRFGVKFYPFRERELMAEKTQALRGRVAHELGLDELLAGIERARSPRRK
jgi:tripartite ATP-independent transporter DctP family solute receptor